MNDRTTTSAPGGSVSPASLPVGAVVATGLALGVAADILLRGPGGPGLNFFLLFSGLGAAVWVLSRRVGLSLSRESAVTLGVGIAFAAMLVLRGSELLRVLAFFAAAVAFSLPALRAGAAWLRGSGVREQVEAVMGAALNGAVGAVRLVGAALSGRSGQDGAAAKPGEEGGADEADRHPAWGVLLGLLLAIPFLVVFGALFMSADQVFAELVTDIVRFDLEEIVSHLVVTALLTWLACGYLSGFLTGTRPIPLPEMFRMRPRVGILEMGIALALVDLLFAAFVGVQLRYLFGGSGLVEVTPGLTYAEYAREGFEQLALASALVLPALLAADWLLYSRDRRDALVFRVLGGLLLLLLVVIIASALHRVRAYQAAYGLTELRFYGVAFLAWLTLVTGWFAATVLRGWRERFAFPVLASCFAFLALLMAVNPDVRIARTNLERATETSSEAERPGGGLDARYLASLSADAVPTLMDALPDLAAEPRCVLARGLLERWGPDGTRGSDWRSWNWSTARARARVGASAGTLRSMVADGVGETCPGDEP